MSANIQRAETSDYACTDQLIESEKLAVAGRLASSIAHEAHNPPQAVTNLLYLAAGEEGGVKIRQSIT